MSYTFEKTITHKWVVTKVWWNFMNFGDFYRVRKDIKKCDLCKGVFTETDMAHLAFVKEKKNHLICSECATTAIEGGAEKTEVGKRNV